MDENAQLQSYLDAWYAARPETKLLHLFAKPSLSEKLFACFAHQIESTVFAVRENKVAAIKLSWWHQQITSPPASLTHPVLAALRNLPSFENIPARDWSDLFELTLEWLDDPIIEDFAAYQAQFTRIATVLSRIEAALSQAPLHDDDAIAWSKSLMLAELLEFSLRKHRNRQLWPMDWRARFLLPSDIGDARFQSASQSMLLCFVGALENNSRSIYASKLNRARLCLVKVATQQARRNIGGVVNGEITWPRFNTVLALWRAVGN